MSDDTDTSDAAQAGDSQPSLARFETSISELEQVVQSLEGGDITLEEALQRFERGVALTRECQTLLKNAELRVDQLLSDAGGEHVADFEPGAADNSES